MHSLKSRLFVYGVSFACSMSLSAQTVDLSRLPPSLSPPVDPNMVVTLDDSGSMGFNYMGDQRPHDPVFSTTSWSGPWRCAGVIDPTVTSANTPENKARMGTMNGAYYNPNIRYLPPMYPTTTGSASLPNMDPTNTSNYTQVPVDGLAVGGWPTALARDAAAHYGNPLQIYPDTSGTAVPKTATTNLMSTSTAPDKRWRCGTDVMIIGGVSTRTTPTNDGGSSQPYWETVYPSNVGSGPYYYQLKSNVVLFNTTTNAIDLAVLYNPNNWVAVKVTDLTNFANWYAYYRTRNLAARTSLSRSFIQVGNMGYKMRIAYQTLNATTALLTLPSANGYPSTTVRSDLPSTTQIFDFADQRKTWFYEWLYLVPGTTSSTPSRTAMIRAGEFFKKTAGSFNPYWEPAVGGNLSCRKNYHMMITDGYWNDTDPLTNPYTGTTYTPPYLTYQLGTASPQLGGMIPYYGMGGVNDIFWSDQSAPYQNSLANIAFSYWASDLVSSLANNVPISINDRNMAAPGSGYNNTLPMGMESDLLWLSSNRPAVYYNPVNDPATWQHVVQFMVGMGVSGALSYPEDYRDLLRGDKVWPYAPSNRIDDMWHAAVVSRGQFFSVKSPQDMVDGVNQALLTVMSRQSTAASVGLSSSVLVDNSALAYSTQANVSLGWGTLLAKNIDSNTGMFVDPPVWDADALLVARDLNLNPRRIFTSKPGNVRVDLMKPGLGFGQIGNVWTSLTSTQQNWLLTDPDTGVVSTDITLGQNRLKFILGDRSNESITNPLFRQRPGLLGPSVRAVPVYNAGADSGYSDSMFPVGSPEQTAAAADNNASYTRFVEISKTRPPTVYVAANDGMIHAFNAATGEERWAYIPYEVFRNLNSLTSKKFSYRPFVDATPVIKDAFFWGYWHTILVGGLGFGGKGIYALDITDPNNPSLLWEFSREVVTTRFSTNGQPTGMTVSNPQFQDLGYTFGHANPVYMRNVTYAGTTRNRWVVLVPSGYTPNLASSPPQDMYDAYMMTGTSTTPQHSSLYVLDLMSGDIIQKIDTPTSANGHTGIPSYGLTTTAAGSYSGFPADFAVAGDVVGNLWRFDFTGPTANWTAPGNVDLLFHTYTYASGGTTGEGNQPITVQPMMFSDNATGKLMIMFGTGKLLGTTDQLPGATQAIYSVREYGKNYTGYPFNVSNLAYVSTTDTTSGRSISFTPGSASANAGWYMPLNNSATAWEQVITPAARLGNLAVIASTSVNSSDRCSPQLSGYVMVFDPGNIQSPAPTISTVANIIGVKVSNPPLSDSLAMAASLNKNKIMLPGTTIPGGTSAISINDTLARRKSWRDITQPPAQ